MQIALLSNALLIALWAHMPSMKLGSASTVARIQIFIVKLAQELVSEIVALPIIPTLIGL